MFRGQGSVFRDVAGLGESGFSQGCRGLGILVPLRDPHITLRNLEADSSTFEEALLPNPS